ncbi:hypothetical protein, partial [Sinorhizobium meliloti]|uniref:hypothetical protein n=1 Tax=Rhizobium meliloti TaxID=382 RepID=UPI0018659CA0
AKDQEQPERTGGAAFSAFTDNAAPAKDQQQPAQTESKPFSAFSDRAEGKEQDTGRERSRPAPGNKPEPPKGE